MKDRVQSSNKKLITLLAVRRGDWIIKVSVMSNQILLIASHLIFLDGVVVRTFYNPVDVFNYIENLVKE
jgi:hypothetical protein